MKKRCAWCGEEITVTISRFIKSQKCPHCNGECTLKSSKLDIPIIIIILTACVLICSEYYDNFIINICLLIMIAISHNFSIHLNTFEKDCYKYISEFENIASIDLGKKPNRLWLILIANYIFPICFVDENDNAISQTGYASIEVIRLSKGTCECRVTYLCKGNLSEWQPVGTSFYIFHNEKKIGKGVIIE